MVLGNDLENPNFMGDSVGQSLEETKPSYFDSKIQSTVNGSKHNVSKMTSQNMSVYSNTDEKNKPYISVYDASPIRRDSVSMNKEFKVANIAKLAKQLQSINSPRNTVTSGYQHRHKTLASPVHSLTTRSHKKRR